MTSTQIHYRKVPRKRYQTTTEASISAVWLRGRVATADNGLLQIKDDTLTIGAGYRWDGATNARDSSKTLRASLFHDAFYDLLRAGALPPILRQEIDSLFLAMLHADGVSRIRLRYFGLIRKLGGLTAKRKDLPRIRTAP